MSKDLPIRRALVVLAAGLLTSGCGGVDAADTGGVASAATPSPRAQKCAIVYNAELTACQQIDAEGNLNSNGGVKTGVNRPPRKATRGPSERPSASGLSGGAGLGGGSTGGGCIFANEQELNDWKQENPDQVPPSTEGCTF